MNVRDTLSPCTPATEAFINQQYKSARLIIIAGGESETQLFDAQKKAALNERAELDRIFKAAK